MKDYQKKYASEKANRLLAERRVAELERELLGMRQSNEQFKEQIQDILSMLR